MSKQDIVNMWREQSIVTDERVVRAFLAVPREQFVTEALKAHAYVDVPLPILYGKTISQPTTILIMTQALGLHPGSKVLEVGTGSGYQAAILACIIGREGRVVTTEVVPELVRFSKKNLGTLGVRNVTVLEEDGSQGCEAEAPFDAIIVTAACPAVPQPLIHQLKKGGVIVAPVGTVTEQKVYRMRKVSNDVLEKAPLGDFRFLPLVGKHGFSEEEAEQ